MKKKFVVFAILSFTFISAITFGYDNIIAHPSFSEKAVEIYNAKFGGNVSDKQRELIKKGSTNEDSSPRYTNHFYDPTTGKGLDDGVLKGTSAKSWAFSQSGAGGDFSVPTILSMYKKGETDLAYEGVGHIMHLVQDMAVPAHTRNDSHATGDSYEKWVSENINLNNIDVSEIPNLEIGQIFDELAKYTHDGFLTQDTIDNNFLNQNKNNYAIVSKFLPAKNKFLKYLYKNSYIVSAIDDSSLIWTYYIDKDDNNIHSSYYRILSPQAIKYSLATLNYFQREFAKIDAEKQAIVLSKWQATKLSVAKISDEMTYNFWGATASMEFATIKTAVAVADFTQTSARAIAETTRSLADKIGGFTNKINSLFSDAAQFQAAGPLIQPIIQPSERVNPSVELIDSSVPNIDVNLSANVVNDPANSAVLLQELAVVQTTLETINAEVSVQSLQPSSSDSSIQKKTASQVVYPVSLPGYVAGFGSGGGGVSDGGNNSPTPSDDVATTTPSLPISSATTTPLSVPIIIFPSDFTQTFSTSTIEFIGSAAASSTISAVYLFDNSTTTATTTASNIGEWTFPLSFNEGTTTIQFFAENYLGEISSLTNVILFYQNPFQTDLIPPDLSLSISDCLNLSNIANECLLATTTANISWSSSSSDFNYFNINRNGEFSTTTATSTLASLQSDTPSNFEISAVDLSGNISATSTRTIGFSAMPIVINEIAWAGADANPSDEWIELYNNTNYDVNFENWKIVSSDGSPDKTLSGIISAHDYYLLERTASSTISDINENLIYTGALNNNGETLSLLYSSTTIDITPIGTWAGGKSDGRFSMERIDVKSSGSDSLNWGTNDGFIKNGLDANGNYVNGAPKSRNSVAYHIIEGSVLNSDKTLTKENSPYFVSQTITISDGKTLNIGEGVEIKFAPSAGLIVNGALNANGTETAPVVFTSFNDKEHGVPLNNFASSTAPAISDWIGILFNGHSATSTISNTKILYSATALNYNDAPIDIANLTFLNNNLGVGTNTVFYPDWNTPLERDPENWEPVFYPGYGIMRATHLTFINNNATSTPDSLFCPIFTMEMENPPEICNPMVM